MVNITYASQWTDKPSTAFQIDHLPLAPPLKFAKLSPLPSPSAASKCPSEFNWQKTANDCTNLASSVRCLTASLLQSQYSPSVELSSRHLPENGSLGGVWN
eukprot:TRINITY_DN36001_c0_g1_i1.p1 TRINITY_DN36001_c0_g1~~TRINITY_DN36001_c0_g1_i1.p1  ORF type:complete len:101 (+),score=9.03 TRINITY_DN36001_c0_g1_i1:147-449(+)